MKKTITKHSNVLSHSQIKHSKFDLEKSFKQDVVINSIDYAYRETGDLHFLVDVLYINTNEKPQKNIIKDRFLLERYHVLRDQGLNEFIVTVTSWTDEN